ncbi:hypothetical protein OF83DRAFT_1180611 [Amylostereum chailletii]|nr:hypothetical protein OF83DRAFT_1180611 [Amylostereum chailletii]
MDDNTIEDALEAYISSYPSPSPGPSEYELELERLANVAPWSFYDVLLYRGHLHIAHTSPEQDKLAGLVIWLESRPIGAKVVHRMSGAQSFGLAARELWNGTPGEDGVTVEQWTALNAFVARLCQAGITGFISYPIWAMRDALEDETRTEDTPGLVPAAAVWVLCAGEWIHALSKEEGTDCQTRAERGGSARWKEGPWGYSVGRWELWKDTLRQIADGSELAELPENDRALVKQAYEVMQDLDGY